MNTRIEDDNIEVELLGCASLGPRLRVGRSAVKEGRLKVQFGNGYEHFDLDHYDDLDGRSVPVFVWTDRTRIAE